MAYALVENTADRLVFQQNKSYRNFSRVFIVVAAVFLSTGIAGFFLTESGSFARNFFIVFAIAAAVLAPLGFVIPRLRSRFDPHAIIFDNANGRVEVRQDAGGVQRAFIPYEEIARFAIREVKQSTTSDGMVTSKNYYRFAVHFLKKDGGVWDLLDTTSQTAAQQLFETLRTHVKLEKTSTPARAQLSEKIQTDEPGGENVLRWRNPAARTLLLFLAVAGLIGFVLVFFWNILAGKNFGDEVMFRIVFYFIAGIFALVVIGNLWKLIKDLRTRYGVSVGPGGFRYFEESNSGRVRHERVYALDEIRGVVFHFLLDKEGSSIYILREAEQEIHRKMTEGTIAFSDLKNLLSASLKELRLPLGAFNCTERLQIENWIQEKIAKRTGKNNSEL